jgi:hypothetical protein
MVVFDSPGVGSEQRFALAAASTRPPAGDERSILGSRCVPSTRIVRPSVLTPT